MITERYAHSSDQHTESAQSISWISIVNKNYYQKRTMSSNSSSVFSLADKGKNSCIHRDDNEPCRGEIVRGEIKKRLGERGSVDTQRSMDMQEPPYVVLIRTTCPFFFLFIFFRSPQSARCEYSCIFSDKEGKFQEITSFIYSRHVILRQFQRVLQAHHEYLRMA